LRFRGGWSRDRRCVRLLGVVTAATAVATVVLPGPAQAKSPCGTTVEGVTYQVTGAHIKLQETSDYGDESGDHALASMAGTMAFSHKLPLNSRDSAIFNAVHRPCVAWISGLVLRGIAYNVSVSWFDSGASSGDGPTSGSCTGATKRRQDGLVADASILRSGLNGSIPTRFGFFSDGPLKCSAGQTSTESDQILTDTISEDGGWGNYVYANVSIPVATLHRAGNQITLPIHVAYKKTVKDTSGGPGFTTVEHFKLVWTGTVSLTRAFTCSPHGCKLPT
jgi:hypothetical protein